MPRKEFAGGAAATTLSGAINSTALSITLADGSTYPAGTNPFVIIIGRGTASEEKILVTSRAGSVLTVASTGDRGYDGTTAAAHADGDTVEHCIDAITVDEANAHVNDTSRNDHTQYLQKAGGTMTGEVNFADQLATRPILKDYAETAAEDTDSGATHTIDITTGNVHDVTLTANCTFTFSNPIATGDCTSFTLILRQDATGSRTATWPASVKWPAGTAPTLTTTASGIDVCTFMTVDGGTVWLGFTAGQAMA